MSRDDNPIWDPFRPSGELQKEIGPDGFINQRVMYDEWDPKRRLFKKWDPGVLASIETFDDLWSVTRERAINDRRSVREFYHNRQERLFDYWICEEIAEFASLKLNDPPKVNLSDRETIRLIVDNYEEFYQSLKRRIWRSQKRDSQTYKREGVTVSSTDDSEAVEERERQGDEQAHVDSYLPEKLVTRVDRQMKVMGEEITQDIDAKLDLKEEQAKTEIHEEERAEEYAKKHKGKRGRPKYLKVPLKDHLIDYFEIECLDFIKQNHELIDSIYGHHMADIQRLFIENLGQGKLSARKVAEELGISQRTADRRLALVRSKFKQMSKQLKGKGPEAIHLAIGLFIL